MVLRGDASYLRIDTSIDCNSPTFKRFCVFDSLLIALYLSVRARRRGSCCHCELRCAA